MTSLKLRYPAPVALSHTGKHIMRCAACLLACMRCNTAATLVGVVDAQVHPSAAMTGSCITACEMTAIMRSGPLQTRRTFGIVTSACAWYTGDHKAAPEVERACEHQSFDVRRGQAGY